jgi:hypothetical protein
MEPFSTISLMTIRLVFMNVINARAQDFLFSLLLLIGFYGCLGAATTDSFTGVVDDTWENNGNWTEGVPPQNGDFVDIPNLTTVILNSSTNSIGSLTVDGTLDIGNLNGSSSGSIIWSGTQSWGGSGQIIIDNGSVENSNSAAADTLTFLPSLAMSGGDIAVFGDDSAASILIFEGNLSESNTGNMAISGAWSSSGNIVCIGSGAGSPPVIRLEGTFTGASAATVSGSNGGNVYIEGTLDNTGGNILLTGEWGLLLGGEIIGGTINLTSEMEVFQGTLNGITLARNSIMYIKQYAYVTNGLTVNGQLIDTDTEVQSPAFTSDLIWSGAQSWGGSGSIVGTGNSELTTNRGYINSSDGSTLTIQNGLTITGYIAISGPVINDGEILSIGATSGVGLDDIENFGTIAEQGGYIGIDGTWSNTGTISGDAGMIVLGGNFTTLSVSSISTSNATIVDIIGDMNNSGSNLVLNATTGPWYLDGGEIDSGTITTNGSNDLIATSTGGTLSNVTISAGSVFDITQAGANATTMNGMIVNGAILVGSADGSATGALYWTGTQSWSGIGDIILGGNQNDSVVHGNSLAETLTIVPPLAIGHPLTLAALNASCVYGAAIPVFGYTVTGLLGSDSISSVTETTTATSTSPARNYAITPSGSVYGNGSATDYIISYIDGTLTITPAPLTITANNQIMTAGSTVPILTFTVSGFVNGDTGANLTTQPIISTTATTSSQPGTYPITVSDAADPNYTITFVSGILTVTAPASTGSGASAGSGTGTGTSGGTSASSTSSSGGCGLGSGGLGLVGFALLGLHRIRKCRNKQLT